MSWLAARLMDGRGLFGSSTSRLAIAGLVAVASVVIASRISLFALAIVGLALLATFVYLSFAAPRPMLLALALAPLLDRWVVRSLLPQPMQAYGFMVSEVLLVVTGAAIVAQTWRSGALQAALRHPRTKVLIAFVVLGLGSALLNGVSLEVAGLGILYTVDAIALFYLVRAIGVDERAPAFAIATFAGLALVAATLALGQVILTPDFLGLAVFEGRFGEGLRPGSFFAAQPNLLGAFLGMAVPVVAFGAVARDATRARRRGLLVVLFILLLALIYTFSRGTWLALAVAMLAAGLVIDRRALAVTVVAAVLALGTAFVMPRGVLLEAGSQWSVDLQNALLGRIGSIGEGRDLRFKFIENAVPIIADHPIVGSGPGTYGGAVAARFGSSLYEQYTAGVVPKDRTVDNYWLHATVEFGIVGALLLAGFLGAIVIELIRAARRSTGSLRIALAGTGAAGMTIGLASVTEMLLEGNTTSFPLWYLLGAGTILAATVRSTRPPEPAAARPATDPAAG